jgi:hypothetical protein
MSIKGLTDRGLAFPEIGRVRKGAKKTDNAPGKDLTYFRVDFDEAEVDALTVFTQKYGPNPTEINIILPFDEIERCWDAWLEAYTAGRMVARSDGEKYVYLVDTRTGKAIVKNGLPETPYVEGQPVGTWRNRKTNKDEPIFCKPAGRLKVIIPELARAAYLTVLTGSLHDIGNISAQLAAFKSANGGRIAGIPLVLRRRPKPISTPKADGSRARYVKWMLSIEADPEWVKKYLIETKRLALPGNGLALLSAPDHRPEWKEGEFTDEDPEQEEEPLSEGEIEQGSDTVQEIVIPRGTVPVVTNAVVPPNVVIITNLQPPEPETQYTPEEIEAQLRFA